MPTVHEMAVAASINLENAANGFDVAGNVALALGALNEIAERSA